MVFAGALPSTGDLTMDLKYSDRKIHRTYSSSKRDLVPCVNFGDWLLAPYLVLMIVMSNEKC